MDEISKRNFKVLNEQLKVIEGKFNKLYEENHNLRNQINELNNKFMTQEQKLNVLFAKSYGSGATSR